MRKDNRTFIVSGLGAAEMHIGRRPGGKYLNPRPIINWEDAPEEMKKDPKVMWITWEDGEKRTFRKLSKEEREEIKEDNRLNKIYKLQSMYKYILENYGWKYALSFYEWDHWNEQFKECGAEVDLNVPHCRYESSHQCDIQCPFFKGKCEYKGE